MDTHLYVAVRVEQVYLDLESVADTSCTQYKQSFRIGRILYWTTVNRTSMVKIRE